MESLYLIGILVAAAASLYTAFSLRKKIAQQHIETMDKLIELERKISIIRNVAYRLEDESDKPK